MQEALGQADGERFCEAFGITAGGNFEQGRSVVHRFSCPVGARLPEDEDRTLREKLRIWRDRRVRPGKDDKVLAAWNGLALSALARGYQVLGDGRYLEAAQACAAFLQREIWTEWPAAARVAAGTGAYSGLPGGPCGPDGGPRGPVRGRLQSRLDALGGGARGRSAVERFHDPADGGFFSTEAGQADLIFRQKPGFDNAIPSGNTLAARSLLRLSRHLQREDFRSAAEGTLRCFGPWMVQSTEGLPRDVGCPGPGAPGTLNVALSGHPGDSGVRAMLGEVHRALSAGAGALGVPGPAVAPP